MRHLQFFFLLSFLAFSTQILHAQDVAMASTDGTFNSASNKDAIRIDRTGINDVTKHILDNVSIPIEQLGYSNEIRVVVQVNINQRGEISEAYYVDGHKKVSQDVIEALQTLKEVSPILVNGVPTEQTIHLPIVFKN